MSQEQGEMDLVDEQDQSDESKLMGAARKVVQAGIWLIRNGFGRMAILPYASPSGCYWRCEFHPVGRASKAFYRYSTGCGSKYLQQHCGGSIRSTISPQKLAEAIMVSVSDDIKSAISGDVSAEMLRWLEDLERHVEKGYVPEAFHEYTEDYSRWALVSLENLPASSMAPQPGYIPPGQEQTCMDDPEWKSAEAIWKTYSQGPSILIPTAALQDYGNGSVIADRLRQALNDVGPSEGLRVFRASIAEFATTVLDDCEKDTLPISSAPPTDLLTRRAGRLLAMVHELHKAGHQRLRICAGWSPDGKEWRCRILPSSQVQIDGWSPVADGHQYTSTQGKQFFGWTDAEHDDARTLARKFIERFPQTSWAAAGHDWAYAGWFVEILGRAEHGELPSFYSGFDLEPGRRDYPLPPPPIGAARTKAYDPTGYPLISHEELTVDHLPRLGAGYDDLVPFCLSFDGYGGGLRSVEDCTFIADSVEGNGLPTASIESLRVAAFTRQRAIKWMDAWPPDERLVGAIVAVIDELRRRLESRPL